MYYGNRIGEQWRLCGLRAAEYLNWIDTCLECGRMLSYVWSVLYWVLDLCRGQRFGNFCWSIWSVVKTFYCNRVLQRAGRCSMTFVLAVIGNWWNWTDVCVLTMYDMTGVDKKWYFPFLLPGDDGYDRCFNFFLNFYTKFAFNDSWYPGV